MYYGICLSCLCVLSSNTLFLFSALVANKRMYKWSSSTSSVQSLTLIAVHATHADRCCQEWIKSWPQSSSVDCNLTLLWHPYWQTRWLPSHPVAHRHAAAAAVQPSLCIRIFWSSGSLTDNAVLSVLNVNAIYHTWQAHIRTLACGRQDSKREHERR